MVSLWRARECMYNTRSARKRMASACECLRAWRVQVIVLWPFSALSRTVVYRFILYGNFPNGDVEMGVRLAESAKTDMVKTTYPSNFSFHSFAQTMRTVFPMDCKHGVLK